MDHLVTCNLDGDTAAAANSVLTDLPPPPPTSSSAAPPASSPSSGDMKVGAWLGNLRCVIVKVGETSRVHLITHVALVQFVACLERATERVGRPVLVLVLALALALVLGLSLADHLSR